jgi:hypothetical protein
VVHPNREIGRAIEAKLRTTQLISATSSDPEVMRRYKPDYVSRQTYMERLMSNKCRQAPFKRLKYPASACSITPVVFPKLDEAAFTNIVSQAQRSAALLEPKMNQLDEGLRLGEQDRDQELSPRWRAGFDLADGRVLAGKVRAEAYNGMLAIAKTKLKFQDAKSNTWVLQPADKIETGSQSANLAEEKAKTYLNRVIAEHPGTPWGMMAERPSWQHLLGWTWTEQFTPPPEPPPQMTAPDNPPPPGLPNGPQPQALAMPKPKRPPPKPEAGRAGEARNQAARKPSGRCGVTYSIANL